MNAKLWKLAQKIYFELPGIVRKEKCGRALSEQVVTMAIYKSLEESSLNGQTRGNPSEKTTPSVS